jgi:TonB family protein
MKPAYPEAAKQKGITGVVVIMVRVRDRGKPISTTILEATDPILAKAVQKTVDETLFDLTRSGLQRGVYAAGRVIFYFHHEHDNWSVSYPDEF